MSDLKIGFVGLGDQGAPMAEAISDAGLELHVWARRAESFDTISGAKYLRHHNLESLAAVVDDRDRISVAAQIGISIAFPPRPLSDRVSAAALFTAGFFILFARVHLATRCRAVGSLVSGVRRTLADARNRLCGARGRAHRVHYRGRVCNRASPCPRQAR